MTVLLGAGAVPRAPVSSAASRPMQKGISFSSWWSGEYSTLGSDISLERLADTGADWIALIVTGYQDTYYSTTINYSDVSVATDADLVHAINKAHSLGLKVMLKPHVDVRGESQTGYWRGDIGRGFDTEAKWAAWFSSYRQFIEHYAALAQANGVEQFSIGCELMGTTHRASDWRAVAAGVRSKFSGPITYAALMYGMLENVTWWDAVDYIGNDAYYPLTWDDDHHPTIGELEQAWQDYIPWMANLSARYGKPVLLTEVGFRSYHGACTQPGVSLCDGEVDMDEQRAAYEATFRALYNQSWLAGIFWWAWFPDRFESGLYDTGFSPHQKPAEDVIRAWYGAPPRSQAPLIVPDYDNVTPMYQDGLLPGWQNWSWSATVDTGATDQVYSGSRSISAALQPWGALSLHFPTLSPAGRYWLEFQIRASSGTPRLQAFFEADDGTSLCRIPIDDYRHIDGGVISADTWKRVRIPLHEINYLHKGMVRLSIQDRSGNGAPKFWIDDMKLVAGIQPDLTPQVFLPRIGRN